MFLCNSLQNQLVPPSFSPHSFLVGMQVFMWLSVLIYLSIYNIQIYNILLFTYLHLKSVDIDSFKPQLHHVAVDHVVVLSLPHLQSVSHLAPHISSLFTLQARSIHAVQSALQQPREISGSADSWNSTIGLRIGFYSQILLLCPLNKNLALFENCTNQHSGFLIWS